METVKRLILHGLGVLTGIHLTDDDRARLAAIELPEPRPPTAFRL
jgi:hypothetical protein